MNVHHLELFYYVATHGGITEAVRNIPYGIQQPAVSSQIIQLEETLGVTLFQRRPFALTPAGTRLFEFIKPFFGNLESIAAELAGRSRQDIRIGASEVILRDHMPALVHNVRRKFPDIRLTLRNGYQPQLEEWLQKKEIDLAVTLLGDNPPPGLQSVSLLKLPLILLVPKQSGLSSLDDLWKKRKVTEVLISLPGNEIICKSFQRDLGRMKVEWVPRMEVSSLELIQTYVENGYGLGLTLEIPNQNPSKRIRKLRLDGFQEVEFGVLWQGSLSPLAQAFLDEIKARVLTLPGLETGREAR